ncbi:GAF domain-containing protein [Geoglobus sp.]
MPGRDVDRIVETWYRNMKSILPDGFEEIVRDNVRAVLLELVSGNKTVDEVVSGIDESFVEEFLRRSKHPVTFLEGLEELIRVIKKSNPTMYVSLAPVLLQFETRMLKRIIGTYSRVLQSEIDERERISRALKVLSLVNEVILKIDDEMNLLREVCRIVVDEGGYAYAWIGYAESDGTVRAVAHYNSSDYVESIRVTWDDSETGRGPTGTAIRTGTPQVVRNASADEGYGPWRETALRWGFRSSIALPLRQGSTVYGSLNVYAFEPHAFDAKEVELLQHLADNVSYAISKIRTEVKRDELDRLYRALVESTGTAIVVIDGEARIRYANNHAERLMGIGAGSAENMTLTDFLDDRERERLWKACEQAKSHGKRAVQIFRTYVVRADGQRRECLAALTAIENESLYVLSLVDTTEIEVARAQIDENIEKFATLVDGIRNPVTVIHGLVEMHVDDVELKGKIFRELDRIIDLVARLEEGWIYSERVREFLRNSGVLRDR